MIYECCYVRQCVQIETTIEYIFQCEATENILFLKIITSYKVHIFLFFIVFDIFKQLIYHSLHL